MTVQTRMVMVEGGSQGKEWTYDPGRNTQRWDELERELAQTGWFASVRNTPEPGDVHLDVRLEVIETGSFVMGVLSGFTLTIVPMPYSVRVALEATVRAPDGREERYEVEDRAFVVVWLPLAPVMVFRRFDDVTSMVYQNLYRHLLLDLRRDGFLLDGS